MSDGLTAAATPIEPPVVADARDRQLAAALATGGEAALGRALAALGLRPTPALLLAVVRALVEAGCAGLAALLLRRAPAGLDVRAVLGALEDAPSGAEPSEVVRARGAAAARALRAGRPHLHELVPADGGLPDDVRVFRTAAGNRQVVRTAPDASIAFPFPFADHAAEAAGLALGTIADGAGFLLNGVPSPALLARLVDLRTPSGYRPPVDVLEPDPEILALWLHLLDDPSVLDGERIGVCAGPDLLARYAAWRAERRWRREPTHVLTVRRDDFPAPGTPVYDATARAAVRTAAEHVRRPLLDRQAALAAGRDAAAWAQRFRNAGTTGPPLRIVGFTTRYSTVIRHAMRDLAAAFERLGHDCTVVAEPFDHAAEVETDAALAAGPCDLVVVINHLRGELGDRVDPALPVVTWIQDHMPALCTSEAGASVGPLDRVVGAGRGAMVAVHGYPPDRFLDSTNLTDPAVHDATPLPDDVLAPHRCDVAYVGHGSATAEAIVAEVAATGGAALGALCDRVRAEFAARLETAPWVPLVERLEVIRVAEAATPGVRLDPATRRDAIVPVANTLFDRLVRHQALGWVASWATARGRTFRLHGRGWERHPALARWACGEVEHGTELRAVNQAARVTLQVTGYASLHQRLLDAVAAGGCVLTRWNPADFLRGAVLALGRGVRERGISDLGALRSAADDDPALAARVHEVERLGHRSLAPPGTAAHDTTTTLLRDVLALPATLLTEDAVLADVRDGRMLPHRAAADLPGFAATTFASASDLAARLDALVDDPDARRAASAPMRAAVLEHDTFDGLARRLVAAFAAGAETVA